MHRRCFRCTGRSAWTSWYNCRWQFGEWCACLSLEEKNRQREKERERKIHVIINAPVRTHYRVFSVGKTVKRSHCNVAARISFHLRSSRGERLIAFIIIYTNCHLEVFVTTCSTNGNPSNKERISLHATSSFLFLSIVDFSYLLLLLPSILGIFYLIDVILLLR